MRVNESVNFAVFIIMEQLLSYRAFDGADHDTIVIDWVFPQIFWW